MRGIVARSPQLELEAKADVLGNLAAKRKAWIVRLDRDLVGLWRYRQQHYRWPSQRVVSPNDARRLFESYMDCPGPEVHRSFLACVFRRPGWRAVGRIPSTVLRSHAREVRTYEWTGL